MGQARKVKSEQNCRFAAECPFRPGGYFGSQLCYACKVKIQYHLPGDAGTAASGGEEICMPWNNPHTERHDQDLGFAPKLTLEAQKSLWNDFRVSRD
jgi:hypothetical protein